ncbi:MAG: DUF58 domain-containing protein [Planctomycetes bacterium]|nr:DUF58 domain-containing protein [Planctomycetota bacterium]
MTTISTSYLDPESLAKLQGLELRARYIVEGFQSGRHRSSHRGQSVEFTEHREYTTGDDLRYVDWKVFGKTDKVYLKQFEAETNLVCYLLVDISESMLYQSDPKQLSKLEYAQCLAAAMAYVVLRQRDSVSLATFDDQLRELIRESANPASLHQLVHLMASAEANQKSDLGKVLHEASSRFQRPGVVVVISDFLGDVDALLLGLKHLRYQRHEVVLLQVLDPAETDFQFDSPTRFEGLEALPDVLVQPRAIRQAYLAALAEFLKRIEAGCRSLQADYFRVRTDEAMDRVLQQVLRK